MMVSSESKNKQYNITIMWDVYMYGTLCYNINTTDTKMFIGKVQKMYSDTYSTFYM